MAASWFSEPAPVARRVRAYFAPVNRALQQPVLFDPSTLGAFNLDAPPAPWFDLGWIRNFARKSAGKSQAVLTGIPAAALEQVRETLEAEVSLEFMSWTKLTMPLATGAQHMNLLKDASGGTTSPDGAAAVPAVTVLSGSTPTSVVLSSSDEGEGLVSPDHVVFTPLNWMAPQVVTVTGVDDDRVDGNQPFWVRTAPAESDDPGYAGFDGRTAVRIYNLLDSYIYGFALQEATLPFTAPEEMAEQSEQMLAAMENAFPNLAAVQRDLVASGFVYADEFEAGLDIILRALPDPA